MKAGKEVSEVHDAALKVARGEGGRDSEQTIDEFKTRLEESGENSRLALLSDFNQFLNRSNSERNDSCKKGETYLQYAFLDVTVKDRVENGLRITETVDVDLVASSHECGSNDQNTSRSLRIDLFDKHPEGKSLDLLQDERRKSAFNIDNPYQHKTLAEEVYDWFFAGKSKNISLEEQMVFRKEGMRPLFPLQSRQSMVVEYTTQPDDYPNRRFKRQGPAVSKVSQQGSV